MQNESQPKMLSQLNVPFSPGQVSYAASKGNWGESTTGSYWLYLVKVCQKFQFQMLTNKSVLHLPVKQ